MNFKTHFSKNDDVTGYYEAAGGISQTVPGQSQSVAEIISRYNQGLSFSNTKTPIYNGEEYLPDMARMDISEKMDYIAMAKEKVNELQTMLNNDQKKQFHQSQMKLEKEKVPAEPYEVLQTKKQNLQILQKPKQHNYDENPPE